MITVFYDGKCGLCRREINHYMHHAPAGVFIWVDITVTPELFTVFGYTINDGLKILHVRDATGKMHTAVDGFIMIWQQLPRWRLFATITKLPIIHFVASKLYHIFAAWRFKNLGHASCGL
jgi:predicted DCC family thiol-disulfide oxidoreductase YuxK